MGKEDRMNLQDVADRDFLLLQAHWTTDKGLKVIQALQAPPSHTIVHRLEGSGTNRREYFYLWTTAEVVRLLQLPESGGNISEALSLHEWGATPAFDATASALGITGLSSRIVVLVNGTAAGFIDSGHPGPTAPTVPPAHTRSFIPSPEPLADRTLQAEIPEEVAVNDTITLKVMISAPNANAVGLPVALPAGTRLDIVVYPLNGFVAVGKSQGRLVVTKEAASQTLEFKLRATAVGSGTVRVLAYNKGFNLEGFQPGRDRPEPDHRGRRRDRPEHADPNAPRPGEGQRPGPQPCHPGREAERAAGLHSAVQRGRPEPGVERQDVRTIHFASRSRPLL
jgi:hypothetical protein